MDTTKLQLCACGTFKNAKDHVQTEHCGKHRVKANGKRVTYDLPPPCGGHPEDDELPKVEPLM